MWVRQAALSLPYTTGISMTVIVACFTPSPTALDRLATAFA